MSLKDKWQVVDFAQAKAKREPHTAGVVRCLKCRHEWEAVAPTTEEFLECPSCNLAFGVYIYPFVRDVPHWECNCGNDLFFVAPEGVYCPSCSSWQVFPGD